MIPFGVKELLNLIQLSFFFTFWRDLHNLVRHMQLFSWAEATAGKVLRLNDSFKVDHSRWHDHHDEEEVDWNQNPSKNSEGSDWHNWAHGVGEECNCCGTGGYGHSPDTSPERVGHSLLHVSLNDFLTDVLALFPCVDEHKDIISSDSNDQENSNNLQSSEVTDLPDTLHNNCR